jgi:hypothetical protein
LKACTLISDDFTRTGAERRFDVAAVHARFASATTLLAAGSSALPAAKFVPSMTPVLPGARAILTVAYFGRKNRDSFRA